jgi:hypothetical protein
MNIDDKKSNVLQWISREDYKISIKKVTTDFSTVWISNLGINLCIPLMMHDFIKHCDEVLNLHVEIDSSWIGQKGFKIKNNEVEIFLDEAIKYIKEWKIEPDQNEK